MESEAVAVSFLAVILIQRSVQLAPKLSAGRVSEMVCPATIFDQPVIYIEEHAVGKGLVAATGITSLAWRISDLL